MLVADLHQKATAAARANGHYDSSSNMSFSQEPSVTYPNGAIGLSQWDGFMSQEQKAHSISSAASTSFDAQNSSQPHPLAAQHPNHMAPGLQALVNSLPPSATGTPTPQSPYLMQRTHTPVDTAQPAQGSGPLRFTAMRNGT